MRSILLLALLVGSLISTIPACTANDNTETWVLLVAGNDWQDLSREFLYDSYYAYYVFYYKYEIPDAYPNEHIKYYYCYHPYEFEYGTVDGPSTKDNVKSAINWLANVSDSNDNIFIYFACHGGGAWANTELPVDEWTSINESFTHVNAEPWLGDDDEVNYISLPANSDYLGDYDEYYSFANLSKNYRWKEDIPCHVKLKARLVDGANGHADFVSIRVWVWNGICWQSLGAKEITGTEWTTLTYDASVLNNLTRINNARLKIEFCDVGGGGADKGSFEITYAYLCIDPILRGGEIDDPNGDEGLEHYNSTTCEWFGVDECLEVYGDERGYSELYFDDELKDDLSSLSYGQLVVMIQACVIGNETCYSGGFIDDLSGPCRLIITSTNETYFSWGNEVDYELGVQDGFSEFSEGFFDALYGFDTSIDCGGFTVHEDIPINADYNNDSTVSYQEAFKWAFEHDDARWAVRTQNGNVTDPLEPYSDRFPYEVDESPWMDDNGDGLPTFKAGYDIFLLGDFNFDGIVDATDFDLLLCALPPAEYHPLYDLKYDGKIDYLDFAYFYVYCEKRFLSISAAFGGTTAPAPGTYCRILNQHVNVTAIPNSGYYFTYWLFDGAISYENPITVLMNSNHTLRAHWSSGQGGDPCPILFVWNGSEYVDYGVIDIHNPTGEDVTREVPIQKEDVGLSNYKAKFKLREGWLGLNFSESVVDKVKLYAVDNYGNSYPCLLIKARHSRLGWVLPYLLASDDCRVQILLLETIDLTFIVPYQNIQSYTFIIEGCNMYKG